MLNLLMSLITFDVSLSALADISPTSWQESLSRTEVQRACPHTGRAKQDAWRQSQSALSRHLPASSVPYLRTKSHQEQHTDYLIN